MWNAHQTEIVEARIMWYTKGLEELIDFAVARGYERSAIQRVPQRW